MSGWVLLGITITSFLLALIPAALFLRNLSLYTPLPQQRATTRTDRPLISVLIPARNEESHIGNAVRSVLQSAGMDLEVIVLDDGSTDRTAEIVHEIAAGDPRARLETSQPLPKGWCGKNFACQQLATLARHPVLLFLDADVRVSRRDSLARLAQFIEKSGATLVSGVPREQTEGLLEKLIIPLIHFVLLGFLPLACMRSGTDPRFAAACGQIIATRRDIYLATGGHGAIPDRMHDGVALTRNFRSLGFATDLFDATDTFDCRMYQSAIDVWNGFSKNAQEGLGSSKVIVPATLLLLGGQVFPFILIALAPNRLVLALAVAAGVAAFLPRLIGVVRFRQSLLGALLHPLGVLILVSIQWWAFIRSLRRYPASWKGRSYHPSPL